MADQIFGTTTRQYNQHYSSPGVPENHVEKVVIPTTISCAYYQSVTTPTSIRSCPPNVTHFNNSLSEMTPPNAEPDNDLYESTPRSTHYMDYSTSAICTNYGNHSSRTPTTFTNTIGHSFITPRRVSNSSDETFLMPSKLNYSESPRTPAPSSSTYSVHHTVLTPPTSPESDNYSGFIIRRTLAFDVEISPTSQNTPASEDGHPTRTELSNSTFVSLSRARSGSRTRGGSIKPSSLSLPDIGNDNYVSGTRANRKRVSQRQILELEAIFMRSKHPDVYMREQLAMELKLTDEAIRVWFRTRRAKDKRDNKKKPSRGVSVASSHNDVISFMTKRSHHRLRLRV